jgi:hypothetical protein
MRTYQGGSSEIHCGIDDSTPIIVMICLKIEVSPYFLRFALVDLFYFSSCLLSSYFIID